MATLRASPLTTAQDRATLDAADRTWAALRNSTTLAHRPEGRFGLAQASEELLELFDQLTDGYEHSLKLLVG